MDPDEALKELRKLVAQADKLLDSEEDLGPAGELLNDVVMHFSGLDEWIKNGGFLPKAWKKR
jgi:hypothetical protein